MSSNMYGFMCIVPWQGRRYDVQIAYVGTFDDSEESLARATAGWETEDPVELAQYELEHRDWSKKWRGEARICVLSLHGGWLETDPRDFAPPQPSDREIIEAIAAGQATDYVHGWDT
jgi:hypothetical protein